MVLEFLDVPASGGNVFVKSKGKQIKLQTENDKGDLWKTDLN